MFVPLIDFEDPVMVIKPPDTLVNWPAPLVEKFPETLSAIPDAVVIPEAVKLMLLKFCVPEPLIFEEGPLNIIEPVLPVKVPLLIQFPPTVFENPPPLNVVEAPILIFPLKVMFDAAV